MNDTTESMTVLASGDPALIPPALVDVLDAIVELRTANEGAHPDVINLIMSELDTDHMEIIKTLASLITLNQAATGHQTFSEWLSTHEAGRLGSGRAFAAVMYNDRDWPRDLRTYAEFRDYVTQNHVPSTVELFNQAWRHYHALVIAPYGDAGTVRTDTQYAARIGWPNGHDEIHPGTVDGTSRFMAENYVDSHNDDGLRRRREDSKPGTTATATVVKRTVVYGPWYQA